MQYRDTGSILEESPCKLVHFWCADSNAGYPWYFLIKFLDVFRSKVEFRRQSLIIDLLHEAPDACTEPILNDDIPASMAGSEESFIVLI